MAHIPTECQCLGCLALTPEEVESTQKEHFCKGGGTIVDDCKQCQWLSGGPAPTDELP